MSDADAKPSSSADSIIVEIRPLEYSRPRTRITELRRKVSYSSSREWMKGVSIKVCGAKFRPDHDLCWAACSYLHLFIANLVPVRLPVSPDSLLASGLSPINC